MIKHKISIIIAAVLIILIPSLTMLTDFYYILASLATIVVLIFVVLALPIPLSVRLAIIIIVVTIYRNNIILTTRIVSSVVKTIYNNPPSTRSDDAILRNIVEDSFGSTFKLHKEFDKFPSQPSILVCNYCKDRMENSACILFPADLAIMMRDGLKKTVHLHKIVKWPIYTKAKGNYEDTKKQVKEHMKQGRHVFTYITKHPKLRPDYIPVIRSGMFSIAKELGVPVTPVCIDYIDTNMGAITYQNFRIRVGDTFMVDDINDSATRTKTFFKETMSEFIRRKYEGIVDSDTDTNFRVHNMPQPTSR